MKSCKYDKNGKCTLAFCPHDKCYDLIRFSCAHYSLDYWNEREERLFELFIAAEYAGRLNATPYSMVIEAERNAEKVIKELKKREGYDE